MLGRGPEGQEVQRASEREGGQKKRGMGWVELAHLRKPARHALEGDQAWGGEDGHLAELPAKALPQPVAPCNELGVSHNDGPDPAAVLSGRGT